MAKEIETSYTFDATGKKVVLTDRSSVEASKLYAIVNVTRGAMYYALADSDKIVTISGNEITLNAGVSTSGHSNDDVLFILYEDTEILEVLQAIRRGINQIAANIGTTIPDTAGRLRVNMETGATLATVTTLTGQTNMGGYSATPYIPTLINNNASVFRTNIVVTE
jgi:hypothetical protein